MTPSRHQRDKSLRLWRCGFDVREIAAETGLYQHQVQAIVRGVPQIPIVLPVASVPRVYRAARAVKLPVVRGGTFSMLGGRL